MTYFGKGVSVLFLPFKLITIPLVWLFKHRCSFKEGSDVCKSMFCPVGKKGVEGWDNYARAGEWTYRQPLPKSFHTRPIPKVRKYSHLRGNVTVIVETEKDEHLTGITITVNGQELVLN